MKKIALAMLFAASHPAVAADVDLIKKLDPAWKSMESRVTRLVGKSGQRTLLDMAFAQVAVDACPGLAINAKAYDEALTRLSSSKTKDAGEHRRFEQVLMTDFGVYTGLVVAESFLDKPGFCQSVENIKNNKGGPTLFWVTKK
jgi:hypothetical protein